MSRGRKRKRNGYAGTGKTGLQLQRELESRIGKQAQQQSDRRRRARLKTYDNSVKTTIHDPSCEMFSYRECNCV